MHTVALAWQNTPGSSETTHDYGNPLCTSPPASRRRGASSPLNGPEGVHIGKGPKSRLSLSNMAFSWLTLMVAPLGSLILTTDSFASLGLSQQTASDFTKHSTDFTAHVTMLMWSARVKGQKRRSHTRLGCAILYIGYIVLLSLLRYALAPGTVDLL